MADIKCPSCGSTMQKETSPDVTIDKCPDCEGVFLERGELNALATGMSGDIEYCSIDFDFHKDKFPTRSCPKCPDQEMSKINLLKLSDIIFDHCPRCNGFFLDKAEVNGMNAELKASTSNKSAEEFRGTRDGHLVRLDITSDLFVNVVGPFTASAPAEHVSLCVFFENPLKTDLRVFQEWWPTKLAKAIGIFMGQDIKTGNSEFDRLFRVHGEDEESVRKFLTDEVVAELLGFVKDEASIYKDHGSVEISKNSIVYTEGPYVPGSMRDVVEKAAPMVDRFVKLANLLSK